MPKRHVEVVSDEILEFLADEISELCGCLGCTKEDRMVEIEDDTAETLPLTDRIMERYTALHAIYYEISKAK